MKTKTAFQFLKAELEIPRQITIDDADGTKVGNISISELTDIMDKYTEHILESKKEKEPKKKCEVVCCASYGKDKKYIYATEVIEEVAFNIIMCKTCAKVIGIKSGDTIPDNANALLDKYRREK